MRQVAEKIEYSPTAIYVHFADKQELFHELCNEDFARLAAEFQRSVDVADPLERIKQIGRSTSSLASAILIITGSCS